MARRQMAGSVSVVSEPGDSLFIDMGDYGGTPPAPEISATMIRVKGGGASGEYVGRWYEGTGAGQIAFLMDRESWDGEGIKPGSTIELYNGSWSDANANPVDSDTGGTIVFVNRADYPVS